jgi:hypothetical protein
MTDPGQIEPDDLNAATEASMQPTKSKESLARGTDASKLSHDDSGLEHEADVMGSKGVTGN